MKQIKLDYEAYHKNLKYFSFVHPAHRHTPTFKFLCFCLSKERHAGRTILAHNGGGFDFILILATLLEMRFKPKVINQGNRIIAMTVPEIPLVFMDSMKFMTHSLSQMATRFGLPTLKGFCPFKFNHPDYWNKLSPPPTLEDLASFKDDQTSRELKQKYVQSLQGRPYDFNTACLDYCLNDCNILAQGCCYFLKHCFEFQMLLRHRFGPPPSALTKKRQPWIHCFSPPIYTLGALR